MLAVTTLVVLAGGFRLNASAEVAAKPSRAEALYDSLSTKSSSRLLEESKEWIESDTLSERAIVALTIIANRYYEQPSDSILRRQAIEANQMLGNLYMVRVIDYKKAYRSLLTARQIAEENHYYDMLASVYSSLANLYSVNPGDVSRKTQKVAECLSLAADAAMRSGNTDMLRTISISIGFWSFPRKSWGQLEGTVRRIQKNYSTDPGFKAPLMVLDACDKYFAGDTTGAEQCLLEAREALNFKKFSERYSYSLDLILSDLYLATGQYSKAVGIMKSDLEKAEREGHTDYLINVCDQLSHIYICAGDTTSADYYYMKYLRLKNDFSVRSNFGKVEELDFMSQIDSINAQVEQLSIKRQEEKRRNIIIGSGLIILLLMLLTLLWVHLNLQRNHRKLYERNREMLKREEQHKLLREQLEKKLKGEGPSPELPAPAPVKSPEPASGDASPADKEGESEEDLESLKKTYTQILMTFEESRDIYNMGFSISDLAEIVGQPIRVISKAINTCYGDNFHQLLNKYRLREATRLMHKSDSRTFTIESIANSAGFKSRTSFATLFKKSMGMTPSEYWQIARQNEADAPSE